MVVVFFSVIHQITDVCCKWLRKSIYPRNHVSSRVLAVYVNEQLVDLRLCCSIQVELRLINIVHDLVTCSYRLHTIYDPHNKRQRLRVVHESAKIFMPSFSQSLNSAFLSNSFAVSAAYLLKYTLFPKRNTGS